ncbi:beta-galactosidase [Streptomyces viridochromogenes]|uniref:Beta-galactosidase n=1 Tax=Streptomyces viridochromogenes TaxID=1938 RepID=A0A0J7YVY3_STRVR|nr:beta-galactosidase [Streptomyces viridochromogenes]KMS67669.1 beta-galactosidase [Streptomyces viridochromogenes]KOG09993.1 beta-galactosidase [Streptomyces viridochromogenes]KOG20854.1 beta-galactosidase [Streptomyces viridochromogenes]
MTTIHVDGQGVWIDGRPRTLLCASLFYFRLPREQWRERLAQVRASGYTCVDVYLPWNFHESAPGRFSFEGRRDVAAFLDLAREEGLYVIARPGPYICSEWDGGALPAWLGLDPELGVRQNEPRFLEQVTAWFDQVLPLLAERQYPAGGSVIMVQLENELDFFDCADRTGYMTSLRDTAVRHGITVPLIACSGQGDLPGATGDVEGVVPACNFYPDDDSPDIEAEVRRYAALVAERGVPLLVTETNRRHRTLRRLLASGAKLIAPYLQSSGWNFGYTPSSGNWGRPGNFMSHGYDFGGYVTSTGLERPEYAEAQVLARVVETWGSRLALATTVSFDGLGCDFPTSSQPSALELDGGGRLVAVPHLGGEPGTAVVRGVPVAVAPGSCPLMAVDVPLTGATLNLASADLVARADGVLVFSSDVPVTVVLDGTRTEIPVSGRETLAGTTLVVLPSAEAARLRSVDADGTVRPAAGSEKPDAREPTAVREVRRRAEAAPERPAGLHGLPPTLESLGVYRGRGTYRTTTDLTGVDELLLTDAADIVDLSVAGRALPTVAGFGAARRIDVRDVTGAAAIEAVVEIWGHANFDDARLPALRLGALRGLGTLWKVRETTDVSALWTVHGHWAGTPAPTRVLGGWSSTRVAVPVTYSRTVHSATPSALHLRGVVEPLRVSVDDGEPETVHTENPWVLLSAGTHQVSVTLPHHPSGPGLRAELLALDAVRDWSCAVQDDELLTAFAAAVGSGRTEEVRLPLVLKPGEETWLDVDLPASPDGYLVRLDATQVRVTGWAGGECVGRVWSGERPDFSGGDPDALWVPPNWPGLTLLAQGIEGRETPEIRTLWLGGPTD